MGCREKRIRRGRPASGGRKGVSTSILYHRSSFINPRGFTLIELLVVISIIALLLAVLMPAVGRARKQAQAAGCQANLRQWGLYYAMYAEENDGRMPNWWRRGLYCSLLPAVIPDDFFTNEDEELAFSGGAIRGYRKLLLCPATRWQTFETAPSATAGKNGTTRLAWSYGQECSLGNVPGSSYAQNFWAPALRGDYGETVPDLWTSCLVKRAADVPVYSDCRAGEALPYASDAPPAGEDLPLGSAWGLPRYAMDRHGDGINTLFMDWSVRKVGVKELWTLKWTKEFERSGCWTKAGGVRPEDWPQWMRGFKDY
jgi:prepilin-type N-terminal cleavage/methylation domain-containing protein/prepilin-type processing-associated H-X9-DG protein